MELAEKIVLVTGASRGLGRAAAEAMGRRGARLVAVARTQGGLEELDDAIRPGGGAATLVPMDIRDDAAVARLGAAIYERFGRIDLWLHTAAHAPAMAPAPHILEKELDQTLATNMRAYLRLIRALEPLLRLATEAGGRGTALVAAEPESGRAFRALYDGSKAAQAAATRAWAEEAKARITVAEILPPPMATALRAKFYPGETRDGLAKPAEVAERLVGRLGEVQPGARLAL